MEEKSRVYISFVDREYGDFWATLVTLSPLGVDVAPERAPYQLWFYPWTSILGIRVDSGADEKARSA